MTTKVSLHGVVSTTRRRIPAGIPLLAILFVMALIEIGTARAQTFTVLHTFTGRGDGWDSTGVIRDAKGKLYGATFRGGAFNMGMVFKLDKTGKETILHSFTGGDGLWPNGDLIRDKAGNLYGTTYNGGTPEGGQCHYGCGEVFKLDKKGKVTVLWAFTGGTDGGYPLAGVIRDSTGNLYGTTLVGGDPSCNYGQGCGVVFKLDKMGKETVLHTFAYDANGYWPGGVIRDPVGNLYGPAAGGSQTCGYGAGCGLIFKLDTTGKETVLYSFLGESDGGSPGGLVRDREGNLYGPTGIGGDSSYNCGVVFQLNHAGNETVLHAFTGYPTDGAFPDSVVRDAEGNFYGATGGGGDAKCEGNGNLGCGTVYKIDKTGTETVLYSFLGGTDSLGPVGVIRDRAGDFYGTTSFGGDPSCDGGKGCGVVFKLTP